jgi:hypothetical protein
VVAIVAAIFASMELGLPRPVFSPEPAPIHRRMEGLSSSTATPGFSHSNRPDGAPIRSACSGRRWTQGFWRRVAARRPCRGGGVIVGAGWLD